MPGIEATTERAAARDGGIVECTHCGLPVPAGLIDEAADKQFCCAGCRAVHDVIHSCGLDRYYAIREKTDENPTPASTTGKAYAEFDDETFQTLYARDAPGARKTIELYAEGVHCAACVWLIEKLPHVREGVVESRLDYGRSTLSVTWDPRKVPLSRIARQLDSLGYPVHPLRGAAAREHRRLEDRKQLVRIAVAGAAAGNVMIIAFALYGGMFHGMEPAMRTFFRWVSMGITAVGLLWPGWTFLQGAIGALRMRTVHMDLPIAIGLVAGTAWGAANTIRGVGEIYFDSVTVLIFLLLIGRWIQNRQQRRSYDAVEMLFTLTPSTARVRRGDVVRDVPVEALMEGDLVDVRPGESIPADGVVASGETELNLSFLTGESRPVPVMPGDEVNAGATNLSSPLTVRVVATGEQTRLGRLMQLVEDAARRRAPVVRLADRVAGVFVVVVLGLAAATVLWWWRTSPEAAIENAISLLIVTCPCALGLATPLAIISAIGRGAKRGILIKGGEVIEHLDRPGWLLLDKTGTLTRGEMTVVEWRGDEALKPLVAALEARSSHPIARALTALSCDERVIDVDHCMEVTGAGLSGTIDGNDLAVGSRAYLESLDIDLTGRWRQAIEALSARALTPVIVAAGGEVRAVAGLGDPLREGVTETIGVLRDHGWEIGVLSGDHPGVVRAVAKQAGIEADACRGGATPEEKLAIVEAAVRQGTVVMVGDGINDAAALAAATVGVSVRGGAEASLAAADVYLGEQGVAQMAELLRGSRRAMGAIRTNIIASLVYNVIGAGLAVTGVINPLIAAILMPMSSLTVITLSARAKTFGDHQ